MTRSCAGWMLAAAAALALTAAEAKAQTDTAAFDLSIRGLGAGSLAFSGVQDGSSYAVNGRLESGGLLGMLRKMRYDAQAQGRIGRSGYRPSSYTEAADTGKRQSEVALSYRDGVPRVDAYRPARDPRPYDVDPADQGGTVDPLSALYATLRDVEPGQECRVSLQIFDGRRRTQLGLSQPKAEGERVRCAGEFRRIAGYSDEDMAEKSRFPFTLTYAPVENGRMRVIEVTMETLYGTALLTRR